MSFENLGLTVDLQKNVNATGYVEATPVQVAAIPLILENKDVLVRAQTGTGKTAAFALPILQLLEHRDTADRRFPRALVLTPTRELTQQVAKSFTTYGSGIPLKCTAVFGGVGMSAQIDALNRGVDVLVATPGRLLDLMHNNHARLGNVEILVLDEADRMLDMGFIEAITEIVAAVPKKRQSLLFSATYAKAVMNLANQILYRPERVEISSRNEAATLVQQRVYRMNARAKRGVLRHLIQQDHWSKILIFTRTKFGANRLGEYLNQMGITTEVLHGNRSQSSRDKALAAFKSGDIAALVATDVAARGLDITDISHVVNFELPQAPEDYVHRIGRTGRAGNPGDAISLVAPEEKRQLKQIERIMGQYIPVGELKGAKGETISPEQFMDDEAASQRSRQKSRHFPQGKTSRRAPAKDKNHRVGRRRSTK
ncbi:MAG: DEAD/DEAH box helicase [Deltaproteobacteria bacterium]|nr:DEAD/DEAH box helicase [Deltaproteobacteria bacterium]